MASSKETKTVSWKEWEAIYEVWRDKHIPDAKTLTAYGERERAYGELLPRFIDEISKASDIMEDDIFFDVGSGIGSVVFQVAAISGCRSYGIEIRDDLHSIAEKTKVSFMEWTKDRMKGNNPPKVTLFRGDVTKEGEFKRKLLDSTVILINNFCFPEEVNLYLNGLFKVRTYCVHLCIYRFLILLLLLRIYVLSRNYVLVLELLQQRISFPDFTKVKER